jgi:FkbM family methyltransferase
MLNFIKNTNIKNIYFFWIINYFDLFKSIFNKKKRFLIFNFNFFFLIFNYLIIYDKKDKKFFKIYFNTFFDLITIRNTFYIEEYNLFNIKYSKKNIFNNPKKKLIIDCGANIGCSSIFFNRLFENSHIVSVESSKKNFFYLNKNCKSSNFYKINRAISSSNIFYKETNKLDNRENTIKIIKSPIGKKSILINDIISNFKNSEYNFFLIKIDIEGNEKDLFSKNVQWINKFKIIIIELHDWMLPEKQISRSFIKSIAKLNEKKNCSRDLLIFGENLISIKNS